jgi:hypothetical protein
VKESFDQEKKSGGRAVAVVDVDAVAVLGHRLREQWKREHHLSSSSFEFARHHCSELCCQLQE